MNRSAKETLRAELKSNRTRIRIEDFAAAAQPWFNHLLSEPGREPWTVAGFQPTSREPDIRPLLQSAMTAQARVMLPRPEVDRSLTWVQAHQSLLDQRPTGIPRPSGIGLGNAAVPFRQSRVIILVPALAIDPLTGARIGYGGGFYDRLLAALHPNPPAHDPATKNCDRYLIGVCFGQECRQVPAQIHDQTVTHILTETGVRVLGPRDR
jgi:5-formyltetrahydrofolate cyclo-ligase